MLGTSEVLWSWAAEPRRWRAAVQAMGARATLPPRGAFTYNPALESRWGYGIWGKAWYIDIGVSVWRISPA